VIDTKYLIRNKEWVDVILRYTQLAAHKLEYN